MLERHLGGQPLLGLVEQELGEEVDPVLVESGRPLQQLLRRIGRKVVVAQLLVQGNARPTVFSGGAKDLHSQKQSLNTNTKKMSK